MSTTRDYLATPKPFEVLILGDNGVGKTSTRSRFVDDCFPETPLPDSANNYRKQVFVDSKTTVMEVLDADFYSEWAALTSEWAKKADAFIIMFSISSARSFQEVKTFHRQIQMAEGTNKPLLLVGNKCDLEPQYRAVPTEAAQKLATEFGCGYLETSAKEGTNIEKEFHDLLRLHRRTEKEAVEKEAIISGQSKKTGWMKRLSRVLKIQSGGKSGRHTTT